MKDITKLLEKLPNSFNMNSIRLFMARQKQYDNEVPTINQSLRIDQIELLFINKVILTKDNI